jgi:hypothetical protein
MKFHIVHVMKMFRLLDVLRARVKHTYSTYMGEDARTHKAVANYFEVGGKQIGRPANFFSLEVCILNARKSVWRGYFCMRLMRYFEGFAQSFTHNQAKVGFGGFCT